MLSVARKHSSCHFKVPEPVFLWSEDTYSDDHFGTSTWPSHLNFSTHLPLRKVVFDGNLLCYIVTQLCALVIAADIIINNFYDVRKKTLSINLERACLDRFGSQRTKLSTFILIKFSFGFIC